MNSELINEADLDARFLEWRQWLDHPGEIFSGIMDEIVIIRQIWKGYRKILDQAPDEARFNPTFHEWVGHNYGQTIGTAVRRQVEAPRERDLARAVTRPHVSPT